MGGSPDIRLSDMVGEHAGCSEGLYRSDILAWVRIQTQAEFTVMG